ncbi:MAG TPA: 5-formyltetrahydrofolate cyclo-ligase [Rhodoferax sp.]|jgi:5,10-methenyltetrahydrofolate synthetase|nr:5-formyltetrahydrofolate cyclo-ligase [Rhodoferax sp.]HQC85270.1 5-formyltetrahydrofolate cyclo-ligase [Rhodoferax sp.]
MDNSDDLKAAQKKALRKELLEQRLNLPDRLQRADLLQRVMRIWLVGRPDAVIGAYWPIKGEFDPLPALHRWKEDGELLDEPQPRRIGLPVVNKEHKTMIFHAWYPGCPMEEDAYGIPKPKDTEVIVPTLLFAPCVGYGPGGYRLGYGGGFYDRMLASLEPRPFTVGLAFGTGFVEDFEPEPHDLPLDAILNDHGVVWPIN